MTFAVYVIVDPRLEGSIERARAMMRAAPGRIGVQVRAKGEGEDVHAAAVSALLATSAASRTPLWVSTHVDVAAALGVGVHLPESAPEITEVRQSFAGPIAVSCHDAAGLERRHAADLAVLGPVLAVPDKSAPLGWDGIAALVRTTRVPVYALGGLGAPHDLSLARAAGCRGIAVSRALSGDDATGRLLALLA